MLNVKKKKTLVDVHPYPYVMTTYGRCEIIMATESIAIRQGDVRLIKIREIEATPEEILIPCFINRHTDGVVLSLGTLGAPKKVEEKRVFRYTTFLASRDGAIEKDDLLGVVNIVTTAIRVSPFAYVLLRIRHLITHILRRKFHFIT